MLFGNPFAQAGGAQSNGPAAGANTVTQQSPNTGANSGNTNSGTDPTGNTGNNSILPNPLNPQGNNQQLPANQNVQGNDPMADLAKLWETTPVDPANPTPATPGYVPKIDPKQLGDTVGKMDFTKQITPEQRAAMLSGGEAGLTAMMDLINSVGRQAVATTYQAGQNMMASALERAEAGFMEKVPGHVRNANTSAALATNPLVNNPAYAPLVDNVKNQFLNKFPKATPDQVSVAVNGYFDKMAADLKAPATNAAKPDNTQKLRAGAGDADWMDWAAKEVGLS